MRLVHSGVVAGGVLLAACGASRVPSSMRGYEILVERRDPQSVELARAMREAGFRVRRGVRGGSRPTAAVIYFVFRHPGPAEPEWLHIRVADTRTGEIVGGASVSLDSVGPTPRARAEAAVRALLAQGSVATPP